MKTIFLDCFLQLEDMKTELLVIVNKKCYGELLSDFVHTARHTMEIYFV